MHIVNKSFAFHFLWKFANLLKALRNVPWPKIFTWKIPFIIIYFNTKRFVIAKNVSKYYYKSVIHLNKNNKFFIKKFSFFSACVISFLEFIFHSFNGNIFFSFILCNCEKRSASLKQFPPIKISFEISITKKGERKELHCQMD